MLSKEMLIMTSEIIPTGKTYRPLVNGCHTN